MRNFWVGLAVLFLLVGGMSCGGGKASQKSEAAKEQQAVKTPTKQAQPAPVPTKSPATSTTTSGQTAKPSPAAASQPKVSPQPQPKESAAPQPVAKVDTLQKEVKVAVPEPKTEETIKAQPDTIQLARVSQPLPEAVSKPTKVDTVAEATYEVETIAETLAELPPPPPPPTSFLHESELIFDDIYFDENQSAQPSPSFNPNYYISLGKVIRVLKIEPFCHIRLKGHIGFSKGENRTPDLALKRALTVGKMLVALFPEAEQPSIARRLEPVAIGLGEPLVNTTDKSVEALNRRVSFELVCDEVPAKTLADYGTVPPAAPKPAPPARPERQAPAKFSPPATPSAVGALYENGIRLFEQKRYPEAVAIFQEIVELNPRHALADNAQWWIGEAYYNQGEYQKALEAYQRVFELGDSNKSAYAQLRLGYCLLRLNQQEAALQAFQQVMERYPQAVEETTKARKMVQLIGRK